MPVWTCKQCGAQFGESRGRAVRHRSRRFLIEQVERFAGPKPDHMLRMVGSVVAGLGMGEDRQAAPVERRPLRELAELFGQHRQLDASPRVRPHRTRMKMADRHAEPLARLGCNRLRFGKLLGIEIDMRVEILDRGHAQDVVLH